MKVFTVCLHIFFNYKVIPKTLFPLIPYSDSAFDASQFLYVQLMSYFEMHFLQNMSEYEAAPCYTLYGFVES